jgi:hypothetical protein
MIKDESAARDPPSSDTQREHDLVRRVGHQPDCAPMITARVPSVPAKNRAMLKPCSGSKCSRL